MRAEHTATLALDGGIYILGGTTRYPDGNFSYSNFNEIRKFDTKSSQWSYINATGHLASPRVSYTATQLPNRNQILIYGGGNGDLKLTQAYNMVIPEIYNETYLVLTFGFIENNISASNISLLNISDPFRPNWVTSFSNSSTTILNDIDNGFRDDYIAAIVVPIVVLITIAVILYFYKKRGKKYKSPKYSFVIYDSDPRLNIKKNEFNDAENVKYAKLTIDHKEEGYNKVHDNYPADAFCKSLGNTTNMAGQNVEYIKPTEN
ncbi:hypothetical protein BJ944DRAFT_234633 [Cunninghamella echinulata]|nr:hypothetical protein BJ944DRAFT_234633 [Cunninghamella echinulata]